MEETSFYLMTSYCVCVYDTVQETVSEFLKFAKTLHQHFFGEDEIFETFAKTSILAECYVKATYTWNNGGTDMIPSSELFYYILKKKLYRTNRKKEDMKEVRKWLEAIC